MDAGYGTHYKGMQSGAMNYETYGVHAYSYAQGTFDLKAGKSYQWTGRFQMEPLYVAPYEQVLSWSRMEDSATTPGFHMYASGMRNMRAGEFTTVVHENAQVV